MDSSTASVSPALRQFVRSYTRDPDSFVSTIHPEDEMLLFDLPSFGGDRARTSIHYLTQGRRIRDNLLQWVRWHFPNGCAGIQRFMDFACGYGRLTRYLVQELPAERIWVSDIYTGAVRFQEQAFGVHAVPSTPQPAMFPDVGQFDCIYVGSLFSHLPDRTFRPWLKRLYEMLSPGGLLAFSTLDVSRMPAGQVCKEDGYSFAPASESRSLSNAEYGTTYVSEAYVIRQAAQVCGHVPHLRRIPRGLAAHQDVYLLSNRPLRDAGQLSFVHNPEGWLDVCRRDGDMITMGGWAVDRNEFGAVRDVQINVNGRMRALVIPQLRRDDVARHFALPASARCGWMHSLPAEGIGKDDVLSVTATNRFGMEHIVCLSRFGDLMRPA